MEDVQLLHRMENVQVSDEIAEPPFRLSLAIHKVQGMESGFQTVKRNESPNSHLAAVAR